MHMRFFFLCNSLNIILLSFLLPIYLLITITSLLCKIYKYFHHSFISVMNISNFLFVTYLFSLIQEIFIIFSNNFKSLIKLYKSCFAQYTRCLPALLLNNII